MPSRDDQVCPKCKSDDLLLRTKKGEGECLSCGHTFALPTELPLLSQDVAVGGKLNLAPINPSVIASCKRLAESTEWVDAVLEQWPGPIAHEYGRLRELLHDGVVIGAIWMFKDLAEMLIRFPVFVMARDILTNGTNPAHQRKVRQKLLGHVGSKALTMGNWSLFAGELATHIVQTGAPVMFPQVAQVWYQSPNGLTPLSGLLKEITDWRNAEFAHGALKLNLVELLEKIEAPLNALHAALGAVANVWEGTELRTENGTQLMGATSLRSNPERNHHATHRVARIPLFLVRTRDDQTLALAPYMALRKCTACPCQDVFLFDYRESQKTKNLPRVDAFGFIDYYQGHGLVVWGHDDPSLLAEADALDEAPGQTLPLNESFTDLGGDALDSDIAQMLEERALAVRYKHPQYLHDPLNDFLRAAETTGPRVWWLQAPGHIGKSTFISGLDPTYRSILKQKALADDLCVVVFYIRREYQIWPAQFAEQLGAQLREQLNLRAQKKPLPVLDIAAEHPSAALLDWLGAYRLAAAEIGLRRRVLICIDGLDELAETDERSIADFLPAPEGIHFLLTSRPMAQLAPWLRQRLAGRLDTAAVYAVSTEHEGYRKLLREYFTDRMNRVKAKWKDTPDDKRGEKPNGNALFEEAMVQADGCFLYLAFIADLLADGTLAPGEMKNLPSPDAMFGHFLNEIESLHRDTPMGDLFCRVLVHLAAAEEAYDWDDERLPAVAHEPWQGLPLDILSQRIEGRGNGEISVKLAYALYTLKPILGSWKGGDERQARFQIGLKGLTKIVRTRYPERIERVHRQLAENILARFEREGPAASPEDDSASTGKPSEITLNPNEEWQLRYIAAHVARADTEMLSEVAQRTGFIDRLSDLLDKYAAQFSIQSLILPTIRAYHANISLFYLISSSIGEQFPLACANDLAGFYVYRGNALMDTLDTAGALADYKHAIKLQEELRDRLGEQWPPAWACVLAWAYSGHGSALSMKGDTAGAMADFEHAIALGEQRSPDWADETALACFYLNRGVVLDPTGNSDGALADFERAIKLSEELCKKPRKQWPLESTNNLARAYSNRGDVLNSTGNSDGALADFERAIKLREELRDRLGQHWIPNWANELAGTYSNRGNVLQSTGNSDGALADYERAIKLSEELRDRLGQHWIPNWANELAGTYSNRGNVLQSTGNSDGALADFERAIKLREELRDRFGKNWLPDWADDGLARTYLSRGSALQSTGNSDGALADCRHAINLFEDLRNRMGERWPPSWANDLATLYSSHGAILESTGNTAGALTDYGHAITLGKNLRDLLGDQWPLEWARKVANDYFLRCIIMRNTGDISGALTNCEEVIAFLDDLRNQQKWDVTMKDVLKRSYWLRDYLLSLKAPFEETVPQASAQHHIARHGEAVGCATSEPTKVQLSHDSSNVGRNDLCPCDSGKKYKHCHGILS